jgi:hypothetical protein
MSQPDWCTRYAGGGYEEEEEDVPPPPPAPKRAAGRPALEVQKAAAQEKLANLSALTDAARFIFSALDAQTASAELECKKLESRKPRAPARAAPALLPIPPASQAALACESAVVAPSARGKRVSAPVAEAPVAEQGSGGAAGAAGAVHYYDPQSAKRPAWGSGAPGVLQPRTGVLGY